MADSKENKDRRPGVPASAELQAQVIERFVADGGLRGSNQSRASFAQAALAALEHYVSYSCVAKDKVSAFQITDDEDRNLGERFVWWVKDVKNGPHKGTILETLADMVLAEIVKIK